MPHDVDHESIEWRDGNDPRTIPAPVRAAYSELAGEIAVRPIGDGLLHHSYHVRTSGAEFVLQRVSEVFSPGIHTNIQRVTEHLAKHGFRTTSLVATVDGSLSAHLGDLGRWRLMPHLGGVSFSQIQSNAQAHSAGHLIGRFHAAMADFEAPLVELGIPYRDTPLYLAALRSALEKGQSHPLALDANALGMKVFEAFELMGEPADVPTRVIHGDLKLQNLLFESDELPGRDRAFALIDMDTLMRGSLWMEMGDAWRSWCNPRGEEQATALFSMEIFTASVKGFMEGFGEVLAEPERDSLLTAPERICLELCARYVTDALEETYFGWDRSRFSSRGEHNLLRASGQWDFYQAACTSRRDREQVLLEECGC